MKDSRLSLRAFGGWWLVGLAVVACIVRLGGEFWPPAVVLALFLSGVPGGLTVLIIGRRMRLANWDWSGATLIIVVTPVIFFTLGCGGAATFASFPYPMPVLVGGVCGWVFGAALMLGQANWKRESGVSGLAGAVVGLLAMLDLLVHLGVRRLWGFGDPSAAAMTMILGLAWAQCWTLCRCAAGWHPPRGVCEKCGYDLTGNVGGVCPECGMRVFAGTGR